MSHDHPSEVNHPSPIGRTMFHSDVRSASMHIDPRQPAIIHRVHSGKSLVNIYVQHTNTQQLAFITVRSGVHHPSHDLKSRMHTLSEFEEPNEFILRMACCGEACSSSQKALVVPDIRVSAGE